MSTSLSQPTPGTPQEEPGRLSPTTRTALGVLVLARWLTLAWMVGIVVFDRQSLRHPAAAWTGVAVALVLTLYATLEVRRCPERLIGAPFVAAEVGLALGLSVLDGYVFDAGHVFNTTQSIATQWPLLAMGTVGFAFGPTVAAGAGALVGPAEWLGAIANDNGPFSVRQIVSLIATSVFYAACGGVFGWLARSLQRAEAEVADRRARDEVARVMHDTVLQTLALVERRSAAADPALAAAARDADRDVRSFLFGSASTARVGLEQRIRAQVEEVSKRVGLGGAAPVVTVNVIDDGCRLPGGDQDLLARAIGEAVANAIAHSEASRVVVFAETDECGQVEASVLDDGIGFDPGAARASNGIDESIIARMRSFGGDAEIRSIPDRQRGTEVLLWTDPTPARHPATGETPG